MSKVISVHQAARFTTEPPFRNPQPAVGRGLELPVDAEVSQCLGQSFGHIDAADFSTFQSGQFAMGVVSLDQQEPALEVEIIPLEGEEFAKAETSSHGTEKERVVP